MQVTPFCFTEREERFFTLTVKALFFFFCRKKIACPRLGCVFFPAQSITFLRYMFVAVKVVKNIMAKGDNRFGGIVEKVLAVVKKMLCAIGRGLGKD